jgi:hypothetical protein
LIAPFAASAVIGNEHTRAPQGSKMALPSAGAITVTAGSPTPVAYSPLAMTLMATSGSQLDVMRCDEILTRVSINARRRRRHLAFPHFPTARGSR